MPFGSLADDTASAFVSPQYLPPRFVIRDPRNLRKEDIQAFLMHVMERQRNNAEDGFRFNVYEKKRDDHHVALYPGDGVETSTRYVKRQRVPRRTKNKIGTRNNADPGDLGPAEQDLGAGKRLGDAADEVRDCDEDGEWEADIEDVCENSEDDVRDPGTGDIWAGGAENLAGAGEWDPVADDGGAGSLGGTIIHERTINVSAMPYAGPEIHHAHHNHSPIGPRQSQGDSLTLVGQSMANELIAHGYSLEHPVNGPNDGYPQYMVPVSALASLPTDMTDYGAGQGGDLIPIDPILLANTPNHLGRHPSLGIHHRQVRTSDQLAEEEAEALTRQLASRRRPKRNSRYIP